MVETIVTTDNKRPSGRAFILALVLALLVLGCNFPLHRVLADNETDVLVAAKAYSDPTWIQGDWYLSQDIGYRFIYNQFAGRLCSMFPIWVAAIIGRTLIAVLFALVVACLFKDLKLSPWFVPVFILLFLNFQNIGAGENIIESFETKPFAYIAALTALLAYAHKKNIVAAAFSGLAISFHVLVGLYAFMTLVGVAVFDRFINKNITQFQPVGPARVPVWCSRILMILAFLIASSVGITFVVTNFLHVVSLDMARKGGEIYVQLRVPHHTLPSYWTSSHDAAAIIKLLLTLSFLILGLLLARASKTARLFFSYGLLPLVFAGVGLCLLLLHRIDLLKYYWFRFPDAMLPFFGLLAMAYVVQQAGSKFLARLKRPLIGRILATTVIFVVMSWSGACLLTDIGQVFGSSSLVSTPFYLKGSDPNLLDICKWLQNHTAKTTLVAGNPNWQYWYLAAERPVLVSFKHAPQREDQILEWKNRMTLMMDGTPLHTISFRRRLSEKATHLSEKTLKILSKKYHVDVYVGAADRSYSGYPILYRNDKFAVYGLSEKDIEKSAK